MHTHAHGARAHRLVLARTHIHTVLAHTHWCMRTHTQARPHTHARTTTRQPNLKADGLDSECNQSSERTFWQSLDTSHALEEAWGIQTQGRRASWVGGQEHRGGREPGSPWSSGLWLEAVPCMTRTRSASGEGKQSEEEERGRGPSRGDKGPQSSEPRSCPL